MILAKANAVCTAYGITDGGRRQTYAGNAVYTDATGDALLKFRVSLGPAVAHDDAGVAINPVDQTAMFGRLQQLSGLVNNPANPGADSEERAKWLARFNTFFGKTYVRPLFNDIRCTLTDVYNMMTELYNGGRYQGAEFRRFVTTAADAPRQLLRLRRAFLTAPGGVATTAYDVIHYFYQNGCNMAFITEQAAVQLGHLRLSAPANAAFVGFAGWGPGDAGQAGTLPERIQRNERNHFLKHVLHAGVVPIDWHDELRLWWVQLNIQLTRDQAQNHLPPDIYRQVSARFGGGANGATTLPMDQVVPFLRGVRAYGGMGNALVNFLYAAYGPAYVQLAIVTGQNMTDGMVWTAPNMPASQIFVSGRVGARYVIGRMEGNVLGISALYFAEDINAKLAARDRIWGFA